MALVRRGSSETKLEGADIVSGHGLVTEVLLKLAVGSALQDVSYLLTSRPFLCCREMS